MLLVTYPTLYMDHTAVRFLHVSDSIVQESLADQHPVAVVGNELESGQPSEELGRAPRRVQDAMAVRLVGDWEPNLLLDLESAFEERHGLCIAHCVEAPVNRDLTGVMDERTLNLGSEGVEMVEWRSRS